MSTLIQSVPEYLTANTATYKNTGSDAIKSIRSGALARFEEMGVPTTRNEEWKYTSLAELTNSAFAPFSGKHTLTKDEVVRHMLCGPDALLFVFENGKLNKALSSTKLPEGVLIGNIADHFDHPAVHAHLAKHANVSGEAMIALNTAHLLDGAFIHVGPNVECNTPIHLLYLNGGENKMMTFPRNLLVVDKFAKVNVIESFHSRNLKDAVFVDSVTEIVVGYNAKVEWTKIQSENTATTHISHTEVVQDTASYFDIHTITYGGKLVRNNLHIVLNGENITSNLNGLYVGDGYTLIDNHTLVDHAKPNCLSNELYKGVLDGNSKGVFNGKIFVRQDAQKTNAYQSNKNLLMSDGASMNTKPQLEIFADDVKCSHGATTGQLDAEALFYLRSRGIGADTARAFLTVAFAEDVLNRISNESVRVKLIELIDAKLLKGQS